MSQASFQDRLNRLEARSTARAPAPVPKARNRRERLSKALHLLAEGNVTGSYAYPPLFRGLARLGIILKPLHFRSTLGLFVFGFVMLCVIAAFALTMSLLLGQMPRPVARMVDAGFEVFFLGNCVMSAAFAALHKLKARQLGLPKWRDL